MSKSISILTSYPEKGSTHSTKTVGVASYTKSLLVALKKAFSKKELTVFAEQLSQKESEYVEEGIKVKRVWKRNSLSKLFKLFSDITQTNNDTLILSFEAYMFGPLWHSVLVLMFMMLQRSMGKKTITLLHQVVNNFQELEAHSVKTSFLNFSKNILYTLVKLASSNIIVFEEQLKKYLGNGENVIVVPHYIPTVKKIDKTQARKKLGLKENQKYVLYFGYLSPYKGIDWLVENWPQKSNTKLIVAGGINPNHSKNVQMKKFVANINETAKKKNILATGFVKEEDLALYFSAADAVILPYKLFMSSSGPLSFALAYKRPVLLSQPLAEYAHTADFSHALQKAHLKLSDFIFKFESKDLQRVITSISSKKKNFEIFSEEMIVSRQKSEIAKQLTHIIDI